jgi:hypothetical protein
MDEGARLRMRTDGDPGRSSRESPEAETTSISGCGSRQVFGLTGLQLVSSRFLQHAASRSGYSSPIQCQRHESFPFTAAGQFRIYTGFPS